MVYSPFMWNLCDHNQHQSLVWPTHRDGQYAQRVLGAFLRDGVQPYIANVNNQLIVALRGDQVLPLVLGNPDTQHTNSYVSSPMTHYLDYTLREIEIELPPSLPLGRAAPALIALLRPLMRLAHFERVVLVNNWLLSTNLYPALDGDSLRELRDQLVTAYPQHTIIFRSVNVGLNAELMRQLSDLGFYPVFSRQTYLLDPHDRSYRRKKSFQKDVSLFKRTPYRWLDAQQICIEDAGRLRDLYADLYLYKYSFFNPQFTTRFVEHALRDEWLTIYALEHAGRLDAVLGFVQRNGVMTAPCIGYDRHVADSAGLYRLISLKLVEEAEERGLILNQSSGASSFKRHRGSIPALEYNMVYDRHVPLRQRLAWRWLAYVTQRIVIPLMQQYGL